MMRMGRSKIYMGFYAIIEDDYMAYFSLKFQRILSLRKERGFEDYVRRSVR